MNDTVKHYINHCEENVINISGTDSSDDSIEIMEDKFDSDPEINAQSPQNIM